MPDALRLRVAIVDLGMGNLFSVERACEFVGLSATVTSDCRTIENASCVILPWIGAFGQAMSALHELDLVSPLRDVAQSGTPLVGICLGMHLLCKEGREFGRHRGLGLIEGEVLPLAETTNGAIRIPQTGWRPVHRSPAGGPDAWTESLLTGLADGEFMYFVHSYYVRPFNPSTILSVTEYAGLDLCSAVMHDNIFACRFHPEKSGPAGLQIYENLAKRISADQAT